MRRLGNWPRLTRRDDRPRWLLGGEANRYYSTIRIPNVVAMKVDHHAKLFVGAAITQVFDFLLHNNARFGCLVTEEAFISLQISQGDKVGTVC